MSQLNIHMTQEFARDLNRLMKNLKVKSKAEAIRVAVRECLEHALEKRTPTDFRTWIGRAKEMPLNKKPRFKSDDDLWE
jgi:Arc/MetJ-type ribon-helix-helix transcriptional regulator